MIKTRLVGLLSHAKKYIVYTILWQWAALLSQMLAVFSIADLLEKIAYQNVTTTVVERTVIALILVVIIRFICERMGARSSYLACVDVKRILREKIYEKMLKLGASYNEQVSSSEVVQVSTEGVEQLEGIRLGTCRRLQVHQEGRHGLQPSNDLLQRDGPPGFFFHRCRKR